MKILFSSVQTQKLAFSPFLFGLTFVYPRIFTVNGSPLVSVLARSEEERVSLYGLLQAGAPQALGLAALLLQ